MYAPSMVTPIDGTNNPQLGMIPYVALSVVLMNYGTGVHQWNISLLTYITMAKVCTPLFKNSTYY